MKELKIFNSKNRHEKNDKHEEVVSNIQLKNCSCGSAAQLKRIINKGGVSYSVLVCEKHGEIFSIDREREDNMVKYWNEMHQEQQELVRNPIYPLIKEVKEVTNKKEIAQLLQSNKWVAINAIQMDNGENMFILGRVN